MSGGLVVLISGAKPASQSAVCGPEQDYRLHDKFASRVSGVGELCLASGV